MRGVVSRGRDHVDDAVAKVDLADHVWPVRDAETAFYALVIRRYDVHIRQPAKLIVARPMIEVAMCMHDH